MIIELGKVTAETQHPEPGPQDGVDTFGPDAII
jgi:hypothetical protein